jgi:hypothetical protein
MMTMRTRMLVPAMLVAAVTMAGCGSQGDQTVRGATERCLEQAQSFTGSTRTGVEAACGKMQTYCSDEARRKDPLCQQFLLRYK